MNNTAILARLDKLERENRVLKLAGLLVLVVIAGVAAMQKPNDALTPQPLVTVQKLVLVDEHRGTTAPCSGRTRTGRISCFRGWAPPRGSDCSGRSRASIRSIPGRAAGTIRIGAGKVIPAR